MREFLMKYENGSMVIDVDKFFPTSKPRIRKLLKIANAHEDRTEELLRLIEDRVNDVRAEIADGNKEVGPAGKKLEELKAQVEKWEKLLNTQKACGVNRKILTETREKMKAVQKKKAEAGAEYREIEKRLVRLRKEGLALLEDMEYIRKETDREA